MISTPAEPFPRIAVRISRRPDYLREHHAAPSLLIGHSLGGAAVLAVTDRIPKVCDVATIGAPADPEHLAHLRGESRAERQRLREIAATCPVHRTLQSEIVIDTTVSDDGGDPTATRDELDVGDISASSGIRSGGAHLQRDRFRLRGHGRVRAAHPVDAGHDHRRQLGEIEPATREFLIAGADAAARQREQPDNGICEVRGEPRHFLSSKLMCWVALDRAISMAEQLHAAHAVDEWSSTAAKIRAAILTRGWNEEAGAFTQCRVPDRAGGATA